MAGIPNLPYNFNGAQLAQAAGRANPQTNNMGILEFQVDNLVPGARELLTLTLQAAETPTRRVARGEIQYLNGTVFYPQKAEPLDEMTVTFRDYSDLPARGQLEQWFANVYNEDTGLMSPPSVLKVDATLLLFAGDGTRARNYQLEGVFPLSSPTRKMDFGDGEQQLMEITFSVDFIKALF